MAYNILDQYSLDINWYFADRFNRLIVAASGGGVLPTRIVENDENNELFHKLVLELPIRFKVARNENVTNQIEGLTSENLDFYFRDFEALASRGFYVFDKLRLTNPEDGNYLLVAYPIYNTYTDTYPIEKDKLSLIPKTKRAIISRANQTLFESNFYAKDIVSILNNSTQ